MHPERRKSKRFNVQEGVYACALPEYHKVGAVVDISIDGISLKYIKRERVYKPLNGVIVLEIFDREENFHMTGIPLKASYDVPFKGPHSLVSAFMRRMGGRFRDLSPEQRRQLRRFIMKFAV